MLCKALPGFDESYNVYLKLKGKFQLHLSFYELLSPFEWQADKNGEFKEPTRMAVVNLTKSLGSWMVIKLCNLLL